MILTYDSGYPGVRGSKEQELLAEVLVLHLLLPLLLQQDVGGGDDGGGAEGGARAATGAAQLRHGGDARGTAWTINLVGKLSREESQPDMEEIPLSLWLWLWRGLDVDSCSVQHSVGEVGWIGPPWE